jgi:transposase InsO family protein
VLIDDFTHYIWTFPLRAKSDVFQSLIAFHAYVCTQFQLPLLSLQTDNGKEFDNLALRRHCEQHGVVLQFSCPYTSSQNGKADWIIRTLNDCIRSMLLHAGLPPMNTYASLDASATPTSRTLFTTNSVSDLRHVCFSGTPQTIEDTVALTSTHAMSLHQGMLSLMNLASLSSLRRLKEIRQQLNLQ